MSPFSTKVTSFYEFVSLPSIHGRYRCWFAIFPFSIICFRFTVVGYVTPLTAFITHFNPLIFSYRCRTSIFIIDTCHGRCRLNFLQTWFPVCRSLVFCLLSIVFTHYCAWFCVFFAKSVWSSHIRRFFSFVMTSFLVHGFYWLFLHFRTTFFLFRGRYCLFCFQLFLLVWKPWCVSL